MSGTGALLAVFRVLRRFNDAVSAVAIVLGMAIVAFAVLALLAAALERHVWGYGYAWMNDLPPYLLPWCVFPLMGVLLRGDRHIQVEVAPALLKGRSLQGLRMIVGLIVLVSAVYFCLAGWQATAFFKMLGQVTETEIPVPFWWLYAAFPVGFGVLASFALEAVLGAGLGLTGRPEEEVIGEGRP